MRPTISIGISAYNEESNIRFLLESILDQKGKFSLSEIIIVSDGSTDGTAKQIQKVKDKRIRIIIHKNRQGKIKAVNEIVKLVTGEILIMFDADVLPDSENFISKVIQPILSDKSVGLVGAETISMSPRNFFERVIADSHEVKQQMFKKINHGHNIYLCHGRARAFAKALYSQMEWINDYPEDAQSYLFCLQRGLKFKFTPKAQVFFRSPTVFTDHVKQHNRFLGGKIKLEGYFPSDFVKKQYHIPRKLLLGFIVDFFKKNPLTMVSYGLINVYLVLRYPLNNTYQTMWKIADTSKRVLQ